MRSTVAKDGLGRSSALLDEAPVEHDVREMTAIGGEEMDVLQRVAVDDEKICERARFNDTQLTFHLQNLGVDGRGGVQNVKWRENLAAQRELRALPGVVRAQKVCAEPHL